MAGGRPGALLLRYLLVLTAMNLAWAFAQMPLYTIGQPRVVATAVALGLAYTVFSEWMNTELRESWAYSDLMPRLPLLGTGLAPILQWLVLPPLAWAATGALAGQRRRAGA